MQTILVVKLVCNVKTFHHNQFGFRTTILLETSFYCPNSKISYFHENPKIGVNSAKGFNYCGKQNKEIKNCNSELQLVTKCPTHIKQAKKPTTCISYLIVCVSVLYNFRWESSTSDYIIVWLVNW